jgi:predicted nucleic acid-binding protein
VIVVDTSLVTKWVLPEERSELALALLAALTARSEQIVAPALLPIEFTNVVFQRARRRMWSYEEAAEALDRLFELDLEVHSPSEAERRSLHRRAFALARDYALPATYDAHFVALAEALGCELWTADERLARRLGDRVPYIRLLESYADDP